MLKTQNRLKKNKQFNYIYRHGESKHSKYLSLIFVKTKRPPVKVGFTVSKKVGKSVVRNKVKRRLRESFKQFMPNIKPYNYVFIAREGISEQNFEEIKSIMQNLLVKADCYEKID